MITANYTRARKYVRKTVLPRLAEYVVYSRSEDNEDITSGINWGDEMLFPENDSYYDWTKRLTPASYGSHADKTGRNVWIEALFTYFLIPSFIIIGIIVIMCLRDNWISRRSNDNDFIKLTVPGRTFYGRYNHGILGKYARITQLTEFLRTQLKRIIRVRLLWESIVVVANHLLMYRIFRQEREYMINADECYDIYKKWLGDYFYGIPSVDWQRCLRSVRAYFEWSETGKHFDTVIIHIKSFMKKFPAVKTYELDIYPHISELVLGIVFELVTGLRLDKKKHGSDRKYMNSVKDLHEIISRRMYDPWWRFKWFSRDRRRERECCDDIYKKLSKLYIAELNNMDLAGPEEKKSILEHIMSTKYCQRVPEECVKSMIEFIVFNGHETLTTIICFVLQALAWHEDIQNEVYADQRIVFLADVEEDRLQNVNPDNVDPNNFEEELARDPTEDHFKHVSELDQVIFECLRVFPPFPILYKETTQQFAWINKSPQDSPQPANGSQPQQQTREEANLGAVFEAMQEAVDQRQEGEQGQQGDGQGREGEQGQQGEGQEREGEQGQQEEEQGQEGEQGQQEEEQGQEGEQEGGQEREGEQQEQEQRREARRRREQRRPAPEKSFDANTKVWLHIYAHHRISGKDGFDNECLSPTRRPLPEFVFGDAKRRCPGKTFALFVIRIVVTYILSRFQIVKVIDEEDIKLVAETVLRAEGGHPIKLVPRTMSKNNKWKKYLTQLKKKYGIVDTTDMDLEWEEYQKEVEQKFKKNKRQSSPQLEGSPEERRQSDDAASPQEEIRSPQSVQSASTSREGMQLDDSGLRNRSHRNSSESFLQDSTPKGKSKKGNRKKRR